ncbi:pyridoxamine 5'-phosphate oxidase family protein (plasmid) [Phyllobacterium sp. A18/5-2]|uniref:pyridoxamine 5'-phosphate oxidase family protein n=1 Tax=Phyllobacterium sp. A18/5-2 TaxID=2978392 RepID=UPI0021C6C529|nr:pyridoxamine 5'-phosphate oxidase family protein [Phyllobacterium sp. A18/5-2]UXN66117.1 pyridoxamine 5'-phosphate oxidase family protein [Phyllobacterium sp. A18/5-2]
MIIKEMSQEETKALLERATLGRLACVNDAQPYIMPLSFAYHAVYLYAFTTVGKKVEWMRANPKICVQFDEIAGSNRWQSVIVNGLFEELTNAPDHIDARNKAHELLSKKAEWWQPAYVETIIRHVARPLIPVFFRVIILETTGHKTVETGGA